MVGCSGFEAATAAAFFGAKRSTGKRKDWQNQDQLENLSNQTKACSTSATKTKFLCGLITSVALTWAGVRGMNDDVSFFFFFLSSFFLFFFFASFRNPNFESRWTVTPKPFLLSFLRSLECCRFFFSRGRRCLFEAVFFKLAAKPLLISSTARFASFRFLFVSCCGSCYCVRILYGLFSNAPRTSERDSVTQLDRDRRDNAAAAAAAVSDSRGSNSDSDSTLDSKDRSEPTARVEKSSNIGIVALMPGD